MPAKSASYLSNGLFSPHLYSWFAWFKVRSLKTNLSCTVFIPKCVYAFDYVRKTAWFIRKHLVEHWLISSIHRGYNCDNTTVTSFDKLKCIIITTLCTGLVCLWELLGGMQKQWRRHCSKAFRFAFPNHAAKTVDYIRNNQCDILNRKQKMKNRNPQLLWGIHTHNALTDQMIRWGILFVKTYNYIFKQH